MSPYVNWTQRIYKAIHDISDLEFQRRAWLTNGKEVSSFVEIISTLYDDNQFVDYLSEDVWNKTGLGDDIKKRLKEIMKALDDYSDTDKQEIEILADPQWHKIVSQAKAIVDAMKIGYFII